MSKQVLDIDQAKHLHELGLDTSNASMLYIVNNNGTQMCIPTEIARYIKDLEKGYIICDAFTLQDVLDMLPKEIHEPSHDAKLCIYDEVIFYRYADDDHSETIAASKIEDGCLIDAAYRILCDLIENGYIETRI